MSNRIVYGSRIVNKLLLHRSNLSLKQIQRQELSSNIHVANKKESEHQSTIIQSEADKFSKKPSEWWDPNGIFKALHELNLVRIPFIRDGLVSDSPYEGTITPLKDKKILDVGSGGGILSEGLARLGAEVTGIDVDQKLVTLAQQHSEQNTKSVNKPTYYHSTIEEHSLKFKDYYDGVVASEVIEHVANKELFLKSCVDALKPGGRIFITTPSKTRLSQFLVIWVAEYVLKLIAKGTHDYEMFMTPTELTFLLERNNCNVEIIYGITYNYFTNTFRFTDNKSLMFAMQAVKLP